MLVKPMSIKEIGLQKYLDDTAVIHNGYGYADFFKLYNGQVDTANLARAFQVSRNTMFKWKKIYIESK